MNFYNNFKGHNNDRFVGGGFFGPFILGGIAGSLLTPRPNNNYPVYYYPYPTPYPYYPYSYQSNQYYY